MNFKVGNSSSVKSSEKSKKSSKATSSQSSSFASALSDVKKSEEASVASSVNSVSAVDSFVLDEAKSEVPEDAKSRGYYILDLLEELEKDILAGNDTKVVGKLEEALSVKALDKDNLPPVVQELLEQIESRAVIELEKLKSK